MERLTAWANTRNGRSQRALERVGFRREGVLAGWHRHGEEVHDVVVFGMLRAAWEASRAARVPAAGGGHAAGALRRRLAAPKKNWSINPARRGIHPFVRKGTVAGQGKSVSAAPSEDIGQRTDPREGPLLSRSEAASRRALSRASPRPSGGRSGRHGG